MAEKQVSWYLIYHDTTDEGQRATFEERFDDLDDLMDRAKEVMRIVSIIEGHSYDFEFKDGEVVLL